MCLILYKVFKRSTPALTGWRDVIFPQGMRDYITRVRPTNKWCRGAQKQKVGKRNIFSPSYKAWLFLTPKYQLEKDISTRFSQGLEL